MEVYCQRNGLHVHTRVFSPHGHMDPWLFADGNATFGTPAGFLMIPDHCVFRMFYSQGISLETLSISRADGTPVEQDHPQVWQIFAGNLHLPRGTLTG